jgi:hypothetical protein
VARLSTNPSKPNVDRTADERPNPRWSTATTRRPPRHQLGGQQGEDPEVGAVTVEEHHGLSGAALLGVEAAAVGRGDGVGALGRERDAIVGVGIRRVMEPGEDTLLIDRDAGHKRTREPSGHEVLPAMPAATRPLLPSPRRSPSPGDLGVDEDVEHFTDRAFLGDGFS